MRKIIVFGSRSLRIPNAEYYDIFASGLHSYEQTVSHARRFISQHDNPVLVGYCSNARLMLDSSKGLQATRIGIDYHYRTWGYYRLDCLKYDREFMTNKYMPILKLNPVSAFKLIVKLYKARRYKLWCRERYRESMFDLAIGSVQCGIDADHVLCLSHIEIIKNPELVKIIIDTAR